MILSFKQLTKEPFLPFPTRVPDDPNSSLPPKYHKTIPDLSPSLSSSSLPLLPHPFPSGHGIPFELGALSLQLWLMTYDPLTLLIRHPRPIVPNPPLRRDTHTPQQSDKQQEDIFPKCRIIYILSDWAIGIQVLTSFKMLLPDNGKTVYRHRNLCYRRKTVSWYTSQEFQVIYNTSRRLNTLLLSGHKTSEKLHPSSGLPPLFGVLMPRIYGLFL